MSEANGAGGEVSEGAVHGGNGEEGWGRVGGKDRNDNMISGSKFQDS